MMGMNLHRSCWVKKQSKTRKLMFVVISLTPLSLSLSSSTLFNKAINRFRSCHAVQRKRRGGEEEQQRYRKRGGLDSKRSREYEKKHSTLVSGLVHLDLAMRPTDPVALGS